MWFEALKNSLGLFLSVPKKIKQINKITHTFLSSSQMCLSIFRLASRQQEETAVLVFLFTPAGVAVWNKAPLSSHYYFTAGGGTCGNCSLARVAPSAADKAPRPELMKTFINFLPPFIQLNLLRVLACALV